MNEELMILQAVSKGLMPMNKETMIEYLKASLKWYDWYFSCDYYKQHSDRLTDLAEHRAYEEEYLAVIEGKTSVISNGAKEYLQFHEKYLKSQYTNYTDIDFAKNKGFWSVSYDMWCYLMELLETKKIFTFKFEFDFREFNEGIFK